MHICVLAYTANTFPEILRIKKNLADAYHLFTLYVLYYKRNAALACVYP